MSEIPKDVADHLIYVFAKALSQRGKLFVNKSCNPATLAQPRAHSIHQSFQVIIQNISDSSIPTGSTLPLSAASSDFMKVEPNDLRLLNSHELLRLVIYVATKSSLEFVDPITSEQVHTEGEKKTKIREQRAEGQDITLTAAEMYLSSDFHIGNSTLHNHSYPISRHLLSALSIATFCARASGLKVHSETYDNQSSLSLPSAEVVEAASMAGAKFLTKLGQIMFGGPCSLAGHQHHIHSHELHEINNMHNNRWCKYCSGAISCLVIAALQEFSDGLGPHDLDAFDDSKMGISTTTSSESELGLSQPSSFIVFDHSHEYHGDAVIAGFVNLPRKKNKQGSLSDFVANALGADIATASENDSSSFKIERELNRTSSFQPLGTGDLEFASTPPPPPHTPIAYEETIKPTTRLEIDLAEAIATLSPVVTSASTFNTLPAVALGIHPSFESVHEAIISSSRRSSASSPGGLGFQSPSRAPSSMPLFSVESDATLPTASHISTRNSAKHEKQQPQRSNSNDGKRNDSGAFLVSDISTPNDDTAGDEGYVFARTELDIEDNERLTLPPSAPLVLTEPINNAAVVVDHTPSTHEQSFPGLSFPRTAPMSTSPISPSIAAEGEITSHHHHITLDDSHLSQDDELSSNGSDSDDQVSGGVINSPLPDLISSTYSSSCSMSGYDSTSGSYSSDSSSGHNPNEDKIQERQRMKHYKRRMLVDDAKRKSEQLERIKAQLQLKTLGKIREQVSFWEEKGVLEQKNVGVVDVEDIDQVETEKGSNSTDLLENFKLGRRNEGLCLMQQRRDHGDTEKVSMLTTPVTGIQHTSDKLRLEPISPGNCQPPDHFDVPNLAPPRKSLGNNHYQEQK
ncbi:hypothetical protein BGX27_008271 [Mortierella sp. AM989]|nr:hypothetical protein BGX27_008271 [Mortierella sp. AM989]